MGVKTNGSNMLCQVPRACWRLTGSHPGPNCTAKTRAPRLWADAGPAIRCVGRYVSFDWLLTLEADITPQVCTRPCSARRLSWGGRKGTSAAEGSLLAVACFGDEPRAALCNASACLSRLVVVHGHTEWHRDGGNGN
ncbi:unnamed protein product [Ectocarpus sp. 6 AP-2014]